MSAEQESVEKFLLLGLRGITWSEGHRVPGVSSQTEQSLTELEVNVLLFTVSQSCKSL